MNGLAATKDVVHYDEIGFSVCYQRYPDNPYVPLFEAMRMTRRSSRPESRLWEVLLGDAWEATSDLEEASPFVSGRIESNGTSNITFDRQDGDAMIYCWDLKHVEDLGAVLLRTYDFARAHLPDFMD